MDINIQKYQIVDGVTQVVDPENKFREVIIKGIGRLDEQEIEACCIDIDNIEKCCHNQDFVRAVMSDGFEVENAISTVQNKRDPEVKGGINIEIKIPKPNYFSGTGQTEFSLTDFQYAENPKPWEYNGEKIVVILDTGLDIRLFQESEFRLFDTTQYNSVIMPIKGNPTSNKNIPTPNHGWNFVDDDANLHDEHLHGTLVTKNLLDNLREAKVDDFQILPLKVFRENGQGSFWNIVRAFDYLQELKKMNPSLDIAIINASFGSLQDSHDSFDFGENSMFKAYIDYFKDTAIVVTPAGNEKNDNDKRFHFPSHYASLEHYPKTASQNLFAVAGHSKAGFVELSEGHENSSDLGSNFGKESVNIAVPWRYRLNTLNDTALINLEGTSFSASYLSAKLLDFIVNKPTTKRGSALLNEFMLIKNNKLLDFEELLPLKNGAFLS